MQPLLRKSSHAVFCIHLHIVLVTKYRRKVITNVILNRLQVIFTDLCGQQKASLLEFNGVRLASRREEDHVHLLVNISPDTHISEFVKVLKASSSRLIRKEFKSHVDKYYWKPVFWSSSYFVNSSGGVSLDLTEENEE